MSKIEWTGETWNPIVGCSKISPGCKNCYAETMARRLKAMGMPQYQGVIGDDGRWNGRVEFVESMLEKPLKEKKPTTYFLGSMTDVFHAGVTVTQLTDIFEVMAVTPRHTYQVLTKRADRLLPLWNDIGTGVACRLGKQREPGFWPLKNVWLGVSVENQKMANERIPELLRVQASIRFLSIEPLLGPINLGYAHPCGYYCDEAVGHVDHDFWTPGIKTSIQWVIVGGESGPRARPMHPDWVRYIRDQCQAVGVPLFFKQWGAWYPDKKGLYGVPSQIFGDTVVHRIGKKRAGRLLDGREWMEYPQGAP